MGLQSVPNSYSLPLSPHAFPCTSVGSCHGLHLPSVDVMWDTSQPAEQISRPPPLSPEDFSTPGATEASLPGTSLLSLSPWDCRVVLHTVPLRPGCLAAFPLPLLIRALWRDCWVWLEPTVSASTQRPPLLPSHSH